MNNSKIRENDSQLTQEIDVENSKLKIAQRLDGTDFEVCQRLASGFENDTKLARLQVLMKLKNPCSESVLSHKSS